ncbi:dihydroneopterin aldolase, partial [Actinomyces urogenitalis DSM 15434]
MSTVLTQDQIRLTGLSARGYHGMLPSEREEGQLFVVDAELRLGVRGTAVAAVTDSLRDAVDYSAVAAAIVDVIEGEPVNLIETLAARVAEAALAFEAVREVEVTVHKPQAPLEVAFEDVSVTIVRRSEEDLTAAPSAGRSAFL